jgi:glutathionyl-hydroquinone reductase
VTSSTPAALSPDPERGEDGSFTGGEYVDRVNGFEFLGEAYHATDPGYDIRVTVPVLWDSERDVIVNNESADIFRMQSTVFGALNVNDAVYNIHFKCSLRKLIEYQHLWPYTRDLYQWPGVAATVDFDEIRAHYYLTHPEINPSTLIAVRPAADFDEPPGREAL